MSQDESAKRHSFVSRYSESPTEDVPDRTTTLQERVAFAEQGRDNAIAMRDASDAHRRRAGESAGRRVNALVHLVRYMDSTPPPYFVEARLAEIFKKEIGETTTVVAIERVLPVRDVK